MRNLVDSQEQVLVGGGSDHVCCGQEPPVEDGGIAEEVCAGQLQGDDAEDDPFCEGFRTAKLRNLERATQISIKPLEILSVKCQDQGIRNGNRECARYTRTAHPRSFGWRQNQSKIETYLWMSLNDCLSS